jgi:hypothetical protein
VQAGTEQGPARRPVIEVLYVEGCPNYRGALGLVQRIRAELGIDAELRTTLISDRRRPTRPGFLVPRPSGWTVVMSSLAASRPPSTHSPAACTVSSTALPVSQTSAGCARPCCRQPAAAERPPLDGSRRGGDRGAHAGHPLGGGGAGGGRGREADPARPLAQQGGRAGGWAVAVADHRGPGTDRPRPGRAPGGIPVEQQEKS